MIGGATGFEGFVGKDGLTTVVGSIMVVLSVVWQAIENNTKKKALDVVKAVDANPSINVVPAADTGSGKPSLTVAN